MQYQRSEFGCGPAAITNAAKAIGVVVRQSRVSKAGGTKVDGTGEEGILQAVRYIGLSCRPYESNDRNSAWEWLHGALIQGRPVLLCLDSWSHWACVIGLLGVEKVILIDSTRSIRNKRQNGVHVLSKSAIMLRWWNARRWADGEKRLYAICVGKS